MARSFSAFSHTSGDEIRFVGESWEDGGFSVDDAGNPVKDALGNTVSRYAVTAIDASDADLLADAYAGDGAIEDGDSFVQYLVDAGLTDEQIASVCDQLEVAFSPAAKK